MSATTEILVGLQPWSVTVPPKRAVTLQRATFAAPTATPQQLVHDALEKPHGFEALRRALTPDDRIAIVIEPRLPHLAAMLAEVLRHIGTAGIPPTAITVVTPPHAPERWIDELPDEFADVTAETHDPANVQKLAYLATTKAGRRVYLNRTVVEADFTILLTGRRYDPHSGYAGAAAALFPILSNEETRAAFLGEFTSSVPEANRIASEAAEIGWLLGTPFLVQVIEGAGDSVLDVIAGLLDSSAEGIRRQDARWRGTIGAEADTVIAAVGGSPENITFADLAQAAANAARAVKKGGRIAVLTTAAPDLGAGAELLRTLDCPTGAKQKLAKAKPEDWAAAALWVYAAKSASLFLASGYPDDVAEELFATPIRTQAEVQRLIDTGGSVLLVPDAHKAMVTVSE